MYSRLFLKLFPVFLILFVVSQGRIAAQSLNRPDTAKVHRLREVKIVLRNEVSMRSAVPVQLLKGRELERLQTLSVADALRYFSGIQLKDYGGVGGLKTVNVRSMGANHTNVFYNGAAISNSQNGQVDLGRFSLDNMEEIALYNAQNPELLLPASALASTSSIYLKTIDPIFSRDETYKASLAFKTGSFGLINPSLSFDYKVGRHTSLRFSSEYMNANGRYNFRYTNGVYDTTAVRNNGDISSIRAEFGLHGTPASTLAWNLSGYFYNSERGLPGAIVANKFDYSQRLSDQNYFVQASIKKTWGAYALKVLGKYAEDFSRYTDPEYITTSGFLKNEYLQKNLYLSVSNSYRLNKVVDIAYSADFLRNYMDANLYRFSFPTRFSVLQALALYMHWERFNLSANVLSTTVTEKVKKYNSPADHQRFTPTIMWSWQPLETEKLHLRGFYKSVFRMPTFNDLYYTFTGNTLLKPETTRQYDIGLTYSTSLQAGLINYAEIQTDLYYNTIDNKIVAIPGANLFRWTMFNIGKTAIKGLETNMKLQAGITPALKLSTTLSYTYQQALDNDKRSNSYGAQIPYTPRHSGSFTVTAFTDRLSVNYSFIYTGERYSQSANIPVNYLQPWYTHDLSGSIVFNPTGKHRITLSAEINNVFNQAYDVILNFPMPGRNYRVGLKYKI